MIIQDFLAKFMIKIKFKVRYPAFITENKICTNADTTIGSPCRGDEGIPLVVDTPNENQRFQIGIFTYQFTLGCMRGWPAVHTRVSLLNQHRISIRYSLYLEIEILLFSFRLQDILIGSPKSQD